MKVSSRNNEGDASNCRSVRIERPFRADKGSKVSTQGENGGLHAIFRHSARLYDWMIDRVIAEGWRG